MTDRNRNALAALHYIAEFSAEAIALNPEAIRKRARAAVADAARSERVIAALQDALESTCLADSPCNGLVVDPESGGAVACAPELSCVPCMAREALKLAGASVRIETGRPLRRAVAAAVAESDAEAEARNAATDRVCYVCCARDPECDRCGGTGQVECSHSACRQNWLDTGERACVAAPLRCPPECEWPTSTWADAGAPCPAHGAETPADAWARAHGCGGGCAGWRPGESGIERCDTCARFPDDDAARAYVERAAEALAFFRPRCANCGETLPEGVEFGDRCNNCGAHYYGES